LKNIHKAQQMMMMSIHILFIPAILSTVIHCQCNPILHTQPKFHSPLFWHAKIDASQKFNLECMDTKSASTATTMGEGRKLASSNLPPFPIVHQFLSIWHFQIFILPPSGRAIISSLFLFPSIFGPSINSFGDLFLFTILALLCHPRVYGRKNVIFGHSIKWDIGGKVIINRRAFPVMQQAG
jgi:hypothetical protein